jgi:hypothetical protein
MFSILLYEPPDVRRFQANLPAWEYHALRDSLTASQLKELDKSPAHYQAYLRGQVRYESKAIELGSRVHLLLESPIEFYRKFAERPDGFDGRKTECKALAAAAKAEGVTLLDLDDWLQIHAIVTAYESSDDPLVRIVRESEGQNEISVFWNEQGHAHRCRPDRLVSPSTADCEWLCETYPSLFSVPFGIQLVADFKTTSRYPDPKTWWYTCKDFRYPLAASHYLAGTQADAFIWIALETNPPYTVVGYLMSSVTRATNDERRRFLLQQLHECQATNDWPGLVLSDEERLI